MGHIEVAHVDYYLPDGRMLLSDASFRVGQGMVMALVGPNGAGKTTLFRLVAEVARSVTAIGRFHVHLEHLFDLPFPVVLRPLLRTVNVLHLHSNTITRDEPWEPQRDVYIGRRQRQSDAGGFEPHASGQIRHRDSGAARRHVELRVEIRWDGHPGRAAKQAAHRSRLKAHQ